VTALMTSLCLAVVSIFANAAAYVKHTCKHLRQVLGCHVSAYASAYFVLLCIVCYSQQRELHELEVRQLLELQQAQRAAAAAAATIQPSVSTIASSNYDVKPTTAKRSPHQRQTAWPQ
jgi:hypothetical protein